MITSNLRINQLSRQAFESYLGYLDALDAKDIDRYAAFLAPDISMTFGNASAVTGKAQVTAMLSGYWQSFGSIEHDLLNIYGTDTSYVLEAYNHYVTLDCRKVSVRAVAFTDKDADGLVSSVRVFGDTSPLFANLSQ